MKVVHSRCAGLDVHARSITACVRIATGATVTYDQYTASTTTRGLLALPAWLTTHRCTHVALEATGVYWKPVWHVLEEHLALVSANAMHIRNVPGRKSDAYVDQGVLTEAEALDAARRILYQNNREVYRLEAA